MARKFELHLDAAIVIAVVFAVSFGFNLYQRNQYASLLQKYADTAWKAQTMEVNWKYAKGLWLKCRDGAAKGGR